MTTKVTKNVLDARIEDLNNVGTEDPATAPTNGQLLIYNETTQKWEPSDLTSGVTAEDETRFIAYATALGGW